MQLELDGIIERPAIGSQVKSFWGNYPEAFVMVTILAYNYLTGGYITEYLGKDGQMHEYHISHTNLTILDY